MPIVISSQVFTKQSPGIFLEQVTVRYISELPGGSASKEPACQCRRRNRRRFDPWVGKILWRRAWRPTPVFLLENPMDRGAWRATAHGVTKSRTRLSTHITQLHLYTKNKKWTGLKKKEERYLEKRKRHTPSPGRTTRPVPEGLQEGSLQRRGPAGPLDRSW